MIQDILSLPVKNDVDREQLFEELLLYAYEYAHLLWGRRTRWNSVLPNNEASKFSTIYYTRQKPRRDRRYKHRKHQSLIKFFDLRDRLHEIMEYDDICSVCMEALWTVIVHYKSGHQHFLPYFITHYRWKLAKLLRYLVQSSEIIDDSFAVVLTAQQNHRMISYNELSNWHQYLFELSQINGFSVRQIEEITGIPKTTIAEEVKSACYHVIEVNY